MLIPKNVNTFNKQIYYRINNIEVSEENPYFKSLNSEYILNKEGTELYWVKSQLENITIPESVKEIKVYALMYSEAETIKLPQGITKLGTYILAYSKTKKIEIQSEIEEINNSTFAAAEKLSEVIIHKEKDEISGSPWGNMFGDRAIIWDN